MNALVLPAASSRELVARGLRSGWHWIAAGVLAGVVAAVAVIFAAPHSVVATATVNVVAVNAEGNGASARSAASIVDMPTEVELARSALTAKAALDELGDGWSLGALMRGTSVSGDSGGTVLKIAYRDDDRERATAGADALSRAYLSTRSSLAKSRYEKKVAAIDSRIGELEGALDSTGSDDEKRASLRASIRDLVAQRAALNDPTIEAGQVITSAEQAPTPVSPSRRLVLVAGVLTGAFAGVVALLLRRALSDRIRGGEDLAELLRLPVWLPEFGSIQQNPEEASWSSELDQTTSVFSAGATVSARWASAVELMLSASDASPLLLILDPGSPESDELFLTVRGAIQRAAEGGAASRLEVVDATGPRWRVVRAAADCPVCAIAITPNLRKSQVSQLCDQIEMAGCRCLGAFLLSPQDPRSAVR
ncbi:hypothetical protein M3T53_07920 [Actinomyces sp. B33]|uniref:hypothetical protein n=1 Tax=Actinomyces sp. B33 TaxID=2942131 RepID=UPI0023410D1F|nr:hypothetical protein [Actinomyces sp. B33]MDC4233629.1 hypothetical protein [Actinomyces sp. B33]